MRYNRNIGLAITIAVTVSVAGIVFTENENIKDIEARKEGSGIKAAASFEQETRQCPERSISIKYAGLNYRMPKERRSVCVPQLYPRQRCSSLSILKIQNRSSACGRRASGAGREAHQGQTAFAGIKMRLPEIYVTLSGKKEVNKELCKTTGMKNG